MALVLTYVPKHQFEVQGAVIPDGLTFQYESDLTEDAVIDACRKADFLFVRANYPNISARILENSPSIRMVQSQGTGFDKIDIEAAARLRIPVANVPGQNASTVAEFAIVLIVALQRQMIVFDREIKSGNYAGIREASIKAGLNEIRGCRLGLLGMGAIGLLVARIAILLGAKVAYHDIVRANQDLEKELQLEYMPLDELLSTSDIISLHVPLTDQTRGLIGKRALGLMKSGCLLINTSRGEVVDQNALAIALENGQLRGAAIDTVSPEPPPLDHPLLNLSPSARDRLIITPHVAGITEQALGRLLNHALHNIARVADGQPPDNVVNGIKAARGIRGHGA